MRAVVDNDIILKTVCYDAGELLREFTAETRVGVLGAAQYVVATRMRRANLRCGASLALLRLETFIQTAETIEPSSAESYLAAELEVLAQQQGIPLDSGESQLCAVVISRAVPWLLTGDKRAIRALERLLPLDSRIACLSKKVVCLEQLVLRIEIKARGQLRLKICAEPKVDTALSICFGCSGSNSVDGAIGLESYIAALRAEAQNILSD